MREVPLRGTTKQSSWIATVRFAHLAQTSRCAVRWLLPAAALALAPKCLLCVLAYTGLAAALGLAGPEFCGAPANPHAWTTSLAFLGIICATGCILATVRRKFLHR